MKLKQEKMKINMLIYLFDELHGIGLCENRYQFSSKWLNRSKRYYSSVINENRDISIEPLMNAIVRLKIFADECRVSANPLLIAKADKLDAIRIHVETQLTKSLLTSDPD